MLELTGVASVLRGFHALYWVLAIVLLATVAYRPKSAILKVFLMLIVIGTFGYLPTTSYIESSKRQRFAEEAWAYFKKKCETDAGEKIYQTVKGVRSVQVTKALPPATEKDVADQFWYGDPYSDGLPWDLRAVRAAEKLAFLETKKDGVQGLDFVETPKAQVPKDIRETEGGQYVRLSFEGEARQSTVISIAQPESKYGVEWEDISKPEDREWWVAASRLRIWDLERKSVIAERVGYLIEPGFGSTSGARRPWSAARWPAVGTSCPQLEGTYDDRMFILKILQR